MCSDHACLRVLRARLGRASTERLPRAVREDLFQAGCSTVRREVWSALRDFLTPHIWIPFMYVFYSPDIRHLEVSDTGTVEHPFQKTYKYNPLHPV